VKEAELQTLEVERKARVRLACVCMYVYDFLCVCWSCFLPSAQSVKHFYNRQL